MQLSGSSSEMVAYAPACGELPKAAQLLEEAFVRDVFSWSALISGYVQMGKAHEALNCFERMQREGISPNAVTYTSILKACGSIGDIDKGKEIHREVRSNRLIEKDILLATALVDMYVKCGMLTEAQQMLESLPIRDIVSWNALIVGYAQLGLGYKVWNCFQYIQNEGLSPNVVTYVCILQCCGCICDHKKGEEIHEEIMNKGFLEKDVVFGNASIDMYAKCGELAKVQELLESLHP